MTKLKWRAAPAIVTMASSAVAIVMAGSALGQTKTPSRAGDPVIQATDAGSCAGVFCNADPVKALSDEALRYAGEDPNAVFHTIRARISQSARVDDAAACEAIPVQGGPGLTNSQYYFLSEIGGCAQLACFLEQVPSTVHDYSTLIVDQSCSGANAITETLTLPDRFTLAGVGIDGAGALEFDLPDNVPAIRFKSSPGVPIRMAHIRDLSLAGGCCGQVGIDVSNSQFVYVKNVRLQNFAFGLFGDNAFSIFLDHSSVHNNAFNLVMGDNTTAWRVRDTVTSQGLIGIHMMASARGHLVSGGRIESNWGPGIRIDGAMNVVENTWFEGNGGYSSTQYGVWVTSQAQKTRILANLFSTQLIGDAGVETQKCFNMSFAGNSADVNQC
jgi:hypothetical protein